MAESKKKNCPSCQKHGILIMAGLRRWDSVEISPWPHKPWISAEPQQHGGSQLGHQSQLTKGIAKGHVPGGETWRNPTGFDGWEDLGSIWAIFSEHHQETGGFEDKAGSQLASVAKLQELGTPVPRLECILGLVWLLPDEVLPLPPAAPPPQRPWQMGVDSPREKMVQNDIAMIIIVMISDCHCDYGWLWHIIVMMFILTIVVLVIFHEGFDSQGCLLA